MKVKSISKRISAVLLCLVLVTSLLSAGALAADPGISYIDADGKPQTRDSATAVTESVTEWGASDSGEHWYVVTADTPITIDSLVTVKGNVQLILADGCTLNAAKGINVTGDNSLTIYAQSTGADMGALTATGANSQAGIGGGNYGAGGKITINGGAVTANGGGNGAGIGGGFYSAGGTITINGGAVTANGGSNAAGIGGGGSRGAGGNITINGGTVKATGGSSAAGIGGGADYLSGGAGGNITINGGTVTATGNRNGAGIGGGAGISGGGGESGTFSTGDSGRAVIFASSISDQSKQDSWKGVIFQGADGQVYGTSVTPTEDFEIPESYTLTIKEGQTLTISEGITLTNNGTIVNNGTIDGTVSGNIVADTYYLDTNNEKQNKQANLVTTSSTTWTGNDPDSGWYVVTGNVTIGQRVNVNGDVYLILADGGSLTVNGGINVTGGNSLTIYGQDKGTGALTANGENAPMSPSRAGIGGDQFQSGGTITINGGTVNATGSSDGMGTGGAGIGGGERGAGGEIIINGGTVEATGGDRAAGIGGGSDGAGGKITITGGSVTAKGGGSGGAGIGSGGSGAGGEITITGGTVNATGSGSQYTYGGAGGDAGKITITGGSVTANSGSGAGIGGGENGESGSFSTGENGCAVIFASSISDSNTTDDWDGVIFKDGAGKVYGTNIAPIEDFEIPESSTLTIGDGKTLTISQGITLTNKGTITVNDGGALVNQGTITGNGKIQLNGGSTVQTGDGPEMTLPNGGTIDPGTGAVTPDKGGNVVIGSGEDATTITPPDGQPVTPNGDGSVTIPGGSTVQTGNGPSITVDEGTAGATVGNDGSITLPDGGSATIGSGDNTTTITPPGGGTIKPNGDVVVTVTFDSQGGSQVASQIVAVGTAVTRPADPTRSGYSFQGWYTAANGDTQWDFADPVTGNMTLYARWTQNSSGGGGGTTTYPPAVSNPENGNVTVTPRNPKRGDTVTITPDPDTGYEVDEIIVRDQNGNEIAITQNQDGTCTFIQPGGKVTIEVTYQPAQEPEQPWENPFHDVDEDAWYAGAVQYVQENGLMAGTGPTTFAPDATSSRSMVVTTLWRLEGSPVVNYAMDFTDVAEGSWYAEAVRWAASEGIAGGYGGSSFGPSDTITREQLAVMLYRYAQEQGYDVTASADLSGFSDVNDVSDYALEALKWASAAGIVNGTSENTLTPQGSATRAQVAVMLMRFCENVVQ